MAVTGLAFGAHASADFVGYEVDTFATGDHIQHVVYARFSGPTDTLLNAFHITLAGGEVVAFHQDATSPTRSSSTGSWNPQFAIVATPDSYTMIGGGEGFPSNNSTAFDPDWGGPGANQAQIPFGNFTAGPGWFNQNPPNLQGRVDATGRVKVAQFLLADCTLGATIFLKVGYNDGAGSAALYGEATFELGGGADCNGNGVNDACEIADGSASDCNGNAIPDSCDIADGLETDLNGNSVADSCEFVVGGSGYATIVEAIAAAPAGTEIVVAPGTWSGAIEISSQLTLRSIDGADSTFLSGSGLDASILSVRTLAANGSIVDGFTFLDGTAGTAAYGTRVGGALFLEDCQATIRNCRFLDNQANYGGAVYAIRFDGAIESCDFERNAALVDAGAMQLGFGGTWAVRDCTFTANSAIENGGAIQVVNWTSGPLTDGRIERAVMRGNSSGRLGSALSFYAASGNDLPIVDSLVEENTSDFDGGALSILAGDRAFAISGSRFCLNAPVNITGDIVDLGGNTFSQDCNGNGLCDADEIASGAERRWASGITSRPVPLCCVHTAWLTRPN